MSRLPTDMRQHRPLVIDGTMLATRVAVAALVGRHPDQISRHCTPVACAIRTRLALYDAAEVQSVMTRRRRRVA